MFANTFGPVLVGLGVWVMVFTPLPYDLAGFVLCFGGVVWMSVLAFRR